MQQKIVNQVAPQGFYKEGDASYVKGKKFISSSDIQFLVDEVYAFCFNERARMLKEVENLMTIFRQEHDKNAEDIRMEEQKNFIHRDMSGLRIMKEHEQRLICKLQMLEFIVNVVNR